MPDKKKYHSKQVKELEYYFTSNLLPFEYIKDKLTLHYKELGITKSEAIINKNSEKVLSIISYLIYRNNLYTKDSLATSTYIPLNSKVMKSFLGNDYKIYIDFLLKEKIIELKINSLGVASYRPKEYSKQYILKEPYTSSKIITEKYKYFKYIKGKLAKYITTGIQRKSKFYKYLEKCVNNIKIDEEKINSDVILKDIHKNQIKYFNESNTYLKIDKSGRLYTKFSNTFSLARYYMTYNDKKLIGIDCVNSQPLLAYSLIMLENDAYGLMNFQDVFQYKKDCLDGKIYEILGSDYYTYINEKEEKNKTKSKKKSKPKQNAENKQEYKLTPEERKKVKSMLYKYILFNHKRYNNDFIKVFKKRYPNVYSFIQKNSQEKDQLSFMLRRLESDLWIKDIAKTIYSISIRKRVEIPIITLHDAIYTTPEYIKLVEKIIIKKMYRFLRSMPSLKVETYEYNTSDWLDDVVAYEESREKAFEKKKLKEAKKAKEQKENMEQPAKNADTIVNISSKNNFNEYEKA